MANNTHPIIFSAPMVRAIIYGRKTQTRWILKPDPLLSEIVKLKEPYWWGDAEGDHKFRIPIEINDFLWVRENWCTDAQMDNVPIGDMSPYEPIGYPANDWIIEKSCMMMKAGRIRPSIHMPRKFSRITLHVTDVRVEKLQDISEEDAIAEGSYLNRCACMPPQNSGDAINRFMKQTDCHIHGKEFQSLWNSIHGPYEWNANPWVVAYTFEPIFKNVDEVANG